MQLSVWMKKEGLTDAEFAARLDPPVSAATVCRWRLRRRSPRMRDIRRVMLATGGSVTANDFLSDARGELVPA